jgi:hypothetical protein
MSFIAIEPTTETGDTTTISSGPFWPVIDVDQLRQAMRIDGTVTDHRLNHAAINAVSEVNADLNYWRKEREAEGVTTLADVTAESINDTSVNLHHYRRAVYALTQANLVERYRSFDATAKGNQEADELTPQITELYRDARWAIRNILGITHTTVELI